MLKVGDKCYVCDNSYSYEVTQKGLVNNYPGGYGNCDDDYGKPPLKLTLVATNLKLPGEGAVKGFRDDLNDSIVISEDGRVFFTRLEFLRPEKKNKPVHKEEPPASDGYILVSVLEEYFYYDGYEEYYYEEFEEFYEEDEDDELWYDEEE